MTAAQAGAKIRVLVVDDSVVIRHLLRQALQEDSGIEVVGSEANGVAALARIPQVSPDVVTLDIEMPEMDGLQTLREIRKRHPRLRTIMFSTLTTRGAAATFEALSSGADDYVAKSPNVGALDQSLAALRSELVPKVKQFFSLRRPAAAPLKPSVSGASPNRNGFAKPKIVAIGVSTGGPQALAEVIPRLPAGFPVPIVIVQHMPPTFTRLLAERLDSISPLKVEEAADGMELAAGRVLVARGDHHLQVRGDEGSARALLDQGPQENSCRPSVDVLFRSLAESHRGAVLSVVLTGMGSDGLRGTQALKSRGAFSLAQDEASSIVWGMPGAIVQAGLADRVVPLNQIAPEIIRLAGR
ncbi:MAG: chemotaxis response regulator protein-glutamate methylesterase [Candidatus Sulfopaludibacter sp.]|nr:chemotaxis response regulator protein-glutamate methylesterase [Candidatus Sulfopaludibacter sp.]